MLTKLLRVESAYCFPAEIAHGAVQDCLDKGVDYVLLPHFRDMASVITSYSIHYTKLYETRTTPCWATSVDSTVLMPSSWKNQE